MSLVTETMIEDAATHAVKIVRDIEEPIEQLEAMRAAIDEWRAGEETLLAARRDLVQSLNRYLSYSTMADALGCSKANIHQIIHREG